MLRKVKAGQHFTTEIEPWLTTIQESALWVTPAPLVRPLCRDPSDDKFIEAALAARARLLIARDADLTDLERPFGVEMVTPRQFLGRLPRQVRRQLE